MMKLLSVLAALILLAAAGPAGAADLRQPALTGIDVLVRDEFGPLQGRRIGLITNHTGLDRRGRSTIRLVHEAPGVELVALFHFFDECLCVRVILKVACAPRTGSQCPEQTGEPCTPVLFL